MFRGSVKSTGYPLNSPVSPFTFSPVRHHVPSHFNWTLLKFVFGSLREEGSADRRQYSGYGGNHYELHVGTDRRVGYSRFRVELDLHSHIHPAHVHLYLYYTNYDAAHALWAG
jgi:hypothetical protein